MTRELLKKVKQNKLYTGGLLMQVAGIALINLGKLKDDVLFVSHRTYII